MCVCVCVYILIMVQDRSMEYMTLFESINICAKKMFFIIYCTLRSNGPIKIIKAK